MTMRARLFALLGLAFTTTALPAQSGTTVWSMRMKMPDSIAAKAGGLSEIDMRLTMATDGNRLGMQVDFSESMATAIPGVDLSSIRMNAVVHAGGDSASIGMIFPPELAAQMGGGIGMRIDVAIPDNFDALRVPDMDSLMEAGQGEEPTVTNTGRTSMVGGVQCEEWEMTPTTSTDSMPFGDKMLLCLAEDLPAMKAFNALVEKYLPDMGLDFDELKEQAKKYFGGREMVPVRMIFGTNQDMVLQLESSSNTAPDASFFTLPEGLQPFPVEMLKAMIPATPGM
jgi:hypothetical protein